MPLLHRLLLFFLRFSCSSELDESDSELALLEADELKLPDSSLDSDSDAGFCCCMLSRGMFFKYSRKFSVIPPSPMEVKKLMENHVFLGLSLGKIDSNESCIVGSESHSFSLRIPRCSDSSYTITKYQNQHNKMFQLRGK
ncbi:hypothetical protein ES319_D10G116500v1 [Gossypium barbadense]|uniref:Uncharacterized protein n=2 Tax=Gossypium TaxID=3633 RepID=A0A5J5PPZ6_GOSBA|nr:hypothetical protein ES319_D10G116500v1 [Gossypium barbadense]TYG49811.1 hypothetical protein ES288_D10G124400v1 [Gossypium darwinii]